MRNIVIMLAVCSSVSAVEINGKFINAVRVLESGGQYNPHRTVGDQGKSNGAYQIKATAWADCNRWLKSNGYKTRPYKGWVNDPAISCYYCKLYLSLKQQELAKAKLGRDITYVDVYCAYNMGFAGYRRIGFNPDRHPHQHQLKKLGLMMR